MNHEVVLSIVDRKTNRTLSSRAFPGGLDRGANTYIAAVSAPQKATHWVEVTISNPGIRVLAGDKHLLIQERTDSPTRPVHEGLHEMKCGYALICYPIDQRWFAILEITPSKTRKPRPYRKPKPLRKHEGYFIRFLTLVGLRRERRSLRTVVRKLDDRTIARVRRS